MHTENGILKPTPPFDFDKSLNFLGVFLPTRQEQTISTRTLTKAISIDGQPVVFQVISIGTTESPQLEYTLFSNEPISEVISKSVFERIAFFLSLNDDLQPFYGIGREDGGFAPLIDSLYGYHQVKFLTPFENACWAVLMQRNPMNMAQKTKQVLIVRYGYQLEVHDHVYRAFPAAMQIAVADYDELLQIVRNDRRTEYLIATARAFSEVDDEFLKNAPDEEVEAWLRGIKGIGEWSATFTMIRGLGRTEHVPLTETRLLEAASKVYGHGKELDREALKQLADRYGYWQGYWAHYLRVGT